AEVLAVEVDDDRPSKVELAGGVRTRGLDRGLAGGRVEPAGVEGVRDGGLRGRGRRRAEGGGHDENETDDGRRPTGHTRLRLGSEAGRAGYTGARPAGAAPLGCRGR